MSNGITEAPAAGIGNLIMDNRFAVPNHQRDYSWTDEEVQQLFDDIETALEKSSSVYFLGLMVFLNAPKGLVVLDGQQGGSDHEQRCRSRQRRAAARHPPSFDVAKIARRSTHTDGHARDPRA